MFEKFLERPTCELNTLVGDDMLRNAELAECVFHGLNDPPCIRPLQGAGGDDLAREVVYGDEDVGGPEAPAQDGGQVHAPDMVGIPGGDGTESSDSSGMLADAAGVARGFGLTGWGRRRMFRTAEAERKTRSSASWAAMRRR